MLKKKTAINSKAFESVKNLLHPGVYVTDAYVLGKWLCLQLSSNVRFKVKNN